MLPELPAYAKGGGNEGGQLPGGWATMLHLLRSADGPTRNCHHVRDPVAIRR